MKQHLLLLHGALGSAASFDHLIPGLETNFTIHRIDFAGHGKTQSDQRPFRMNYFAENVLGYLDSHNLATVDVFGYSMGGYVALYLASLTPDRVSSVLTLATKFLWNRETADKEAAMLNPPKMKEKIPAFVSRLESMHQAEGWEFVVEQTRDMMLDLGENPELTDPVLRSVKHRARLMVGDRDLMVSIEETVNAFRNLPNAELAVLPATPHPLERVEPAELVRIIEQFFRP